jgi:hypothetical protein
MKALKSLLSFANPSSKKRTFSNPEQPAHHSGNSIQSFDVIDIDPEKLMDRLRLKFGSEFEIHVSRLLQNGEVEVH